MAVEALEGTKGKITDLGRRELRVQRWSGNRQGVWGPMESLTVWHLLKSTI